MLVRGRSLPRLLLPGVRDIRGYQAMIETSCARFAMAQPEMSLERAMDDQRLMDQIYAGVERHNSPSPFTRADRQPSPNDCD